MAEALLRHALEERGCPNVEVLSCGTWADLDSPATPAAIEAVACLGADISAHRSRPLDPGILRSAALIVVMTSVHLREVLEKAPDVGDRLFLMKELAQIDPAAWAAPTPWERLRRLRTAPRPERRRALDLGDPFGLPPAAYERCAAEIEDGVRVLARVLC
jgi:protein-tyrosine-phosphatase